MRLAILAASAALCLFFSTTSESKPRFETGGVVNCDHRYPATCDQRGWTKEKRATKHRHSFRVPSGRVHSRAAHVHKKARHATQRPAQRVARHEGAEAPAHPADHPNAFGPRPRAWCGWWMALRKGLHDRRLWLAMEWVRVGRPASGPAPGVIGVMRHHVYEVVKVLGPGRVLAISGNDGHAVRTRVRSTGRTIAWREI